MNSSDETIRQLVEIAAHLNRSIPLPLMIFGSIGNFLNLLILTRKPLRKSSCLFYFLSSSVANLICLWCGLTTRFLSGYDLDPTTKNSIVCKIRYFLTYKSLSLSAFFLTYASADRWASSSGNVRVRSFCQIHVARRLVFVTFIIVCLLYSQAFYCYEVEPDKFPIFCVCPYAACRLFNDILFLILFSIVPPFFMIIFAWFTVKNVRKSRHQVHTTTRQNNSQRHIVMKRDRQMVSMLLIQIIFFFLCVLPSGISKAYSTITSISWTERKDRLQLTKENFSFQVTILMLYFNCSCAFYIYILCATSFRREVKLFALKFYRNLRRRISPALVESTI